MFPLKREITAQEVLTRLGNLLVELGEHSHGGRPLPEDIDVLDALKELSQRGWPLRDRLGNLVEVELGNHSQGGGILAEPFDHQLRWLKIDLESVNLKIVEDLIVDARRIVYDAEQFFGSSNILNCTDQKKREVVIDMIRRYCRMVANYLPPDSCVLGLLYFLNNLYSLTDPIDDDVSSIFGHHLIDWIQGDQGSSTIASGGQVVGAAEGEDCFVGLDEQVDLLLPHLVNEGGAGGAYRFISLWGMGGLGKTAIAKAIYNHPDVRGHFRRFSWVSMPNDRSDGDILHGIFDDLFPGCQSSAELGYNMFKKESAEEYQKKKVRFARPGPFFLNSLKNIAACINCKEMNNHLNKETCEELVRRCGGLPLAIVQLGKIMQIEEWCSREALAAPEIIFNSVPMKGRVLEVLATSYDELPHELRSCFLYLRNLPVDAEIEVNKLHQLWVAESLIPSHSLLKGVSTLHLACYYLHVLASRSMVQLQVDETTGLFKYCRVHTLLRDICFLKGNEENLQVMDLRLQKTVVVEDKEVITTMPSSSPIRRINKLAVYLGDLKDIDNYVPPKRGVAGELRSILFFLESELQSRKMQLAKLRNLETLKNFDLRVFNVEDLPHLNNLRKLGAIVTSKDDLGKIVKYLVYEASELLSHYARSRREGCSSEEVHLCVETQPGKANGKIPTMESNTDDDTYVPDDEMDCIWQFGLAQSALLK
ncbi:hypothetical protein LguiA_002249 [Lonicera macranthoides]